MDILTVLSNIFGRKLTDETIEGFYIALKKFPDEFINDAGYKLLEGKYFPKPGEFIEILRDKTYETKEEFIIIRNADCHTCYKKDTTCIKEPVNNGPIVCRQCYTGFTTDEIKGKFNAIFSILDKKSKERYMEELGEIPF